MCVLMNIYVCVFICVYTTSVHYILYMRKIHRKSYQSSKITASTAIHLYICIPNHSPTTNRKQFIYIPSLPPTNETIRTSNNNERKHIMRPCYTVNTREFHHRVATTTEEPNMAPISWLLATLSRSNYRFSAGVNISRSLLAREKSFGWE